MKVILAGYSKTGTKTMTAVFNILGYNTYDTVENYYYLYKGWKRIFKGEATPQEIREIFKGVDAVCDIPVFLYWRELAEAFPEAKIVLTTRDEDSWYKSLMHQLDVMNNFWMRRFTNLLSPTCWMRYTYQRDMFKSLGDFPFLRNTLKTHPEDVIRAHYRKHNDDVLKNAPKDRFLHFKVSEGWEPLCEFLGEEIPDVAFPHKNKGGELIKQLATSSYTLHLFGPAVLTFSCLIAALAYAANILLAYL